MLSNTLFLDDWDALAWGPCRILWAPKGTELPMKWSIVINAAEQYEANLPWREFGHTKSGLAMKSDAIRASLAHYDDARELPGVDIEHALLFVWRSTGTDPNANTLGDFLVSGKYFPRVSYAETPVPPKQENHTSPVTWRKIV